MTIYIVTDKKESFLLTAMEISLPRRILRALMTQKTKRKYCEVMSRHQSDNNGKWKQLMATTNGVGSGVGNNCWRWQQLLALATIVGLGIGLAVGIGR